MLKLLNNLTMGCFCSKEDLNLNGTKYTILNKIADGGFGVISLVEDSRTYQQYALKRVKCESKEELESMGLENKYYKLLGTHTNLINLINEDVKQDPRTRQYTILSIFPYYQNGTLQDEIESNQKSERLIETNRLLTLFLGICDATNFIHESNLAHRDLKPHNVLLSDDRMTAILTDYGSMTERNIEVKDARKVQELVDWAAQNCSMFYRAPELFEPRMGARVTEKGDVWSLGCVLYAMMFKKGPFDYVCEKGDSIAMAVANANYKIPKAKGFRPDYLVDLVDSMIVVEDFKRESLSSVMAVIREHVGDDDTNDPTIV